LRHRSLATVLKLQKPNSTFALSAVCQKEDWSQMDDPNGNFDDLERPVTDAEPEKLSIPTAGLCFGRLNKLMFRLFFVNHFSSQSS
jgi:hypothetical protein